MSTTKNIKLFNKIAIPSDWKIMTIEEIAMKEKGAIKIGPFGSQLKKEEFIENGIKVYDQETAFNNNFFYGSNFISEKKFQKLKSCELKPGDLIISMMGTIGASAIVPYDAPKGILNSHLLRVRPDKSLITVEFLRISISDSPFTVNQINKKSHGGIMSGLSAGIIKSVDIIIPPLYDQKVITHISGLMNSAINANNKLITQKEQRKKWLMQNLLTGKKRLRGFENTKWRIQPLENFIKSVVREVSKPSEPYLGIGLRSHGKGTFLKHDEQPEKNSMDKFYVVRPNDLIVNITFAWEQAIAIVRPEDDGALASHRFPTYTFIDSKGYPDFFRFFILQPRMKFMLELISPGGAGRNRVMSKSDFIKLEFLLPEFDEQTAIAQVLQAADKEIQLLKAKTDKLREQKKGMMQVLLTGKVRLKIYE
jgi:type I restriction enzyme S subunit